MRWMLCVSVLAGLGAASAWAAQTEDANPPAKTGEPPLVVYTALETDEYKVYLEDLRRRHPGIKLRIVRDSTGIMVDKLLGEKKDPKADVVWGLAVTGLLVCKKEGFLAPYAPKGLDKIPPRFYDTDSDPPCWVGIKAWMTGFCCNFELLEERGLKPPKSFADLAGPCYRGQIVMPNPSTSGTGFLTVSAILQLKGEKEGWSYLDKLHENVAFYTHSGSKPAILAAAGDFPVGVSFAYRGVQEKQAGNPVEIHYPSEGSGWDLEANALIKKPQVHPDAHAFLDWAIQPETMRMYAKFYPIVTVDIEQDMPAGYARDPQGQLIENDFDWAAENHARIIEEWKRRYAGKALGSAW